MTFLDKRPMLKFEVIASEPGDDFQAATLQKVRTIWSADIRSDDLLMRLDMMFVGRQYTADFLTGDTPAIAAQKLRALADEIDNAG